MTDQKRYVAAAASGWDGREWLNLWEVEELCRQARKADLPDEAEFKIVHDYAFLRMRYAVTHDPSRRRVVHREERSPVEQAIESRSDRLVEMGFVRSSDSRKPITVRLQVSDDSTNVVMASLDLSEHEFAALLAGSVIKVKDQI